MWAIRDRTAARKHITLADQCVGGCVENLENIFHVNTNTVR